MAGRGKEYTLTFLLKAAADSSYQAAFSKAKQELNQFQKQIEKNNSVLRDISAYQKQEQAVQRAAAKVAEKTKALDAAKAAATAAGNADEELNKQQQKAETAVKNATEKLQQQEQKLRSQGEALKQAGVDTSNLAFEQQKLTVATEDLKQKQEAAADQQNKWIESLAEMEAMAAEAYIVADAVGNLADKWKICMEAASGFEYSMSATEAVSQATEAELAELTSVAKEVGATTIFTATQIADAMEYMGLAGWTAQEMIEGIPAVANLAAASGEDLSMVCDIVTDSMMALGYTTADTERYCDVLAQTSIIANTNVEMMGNSLRYVASTAGALNYSIEDVATAMAALANQGIKADMAGTSLRNILASIADPSNEAAGALEELGVALADENGQVYGLNTVITQLRNSFGGLSEAQKVQYASTIAGKRGMTGILALVNTSQDEYDQLAASITDCTGAAEQMAEVRLDNFKGETILLESAVDALKTSIGEAFLDTGSSVVETMTGMTNAANDFVIENQEVVVGATAAAGAMGLLSVGVTGAATAVKVFNNVVKGSPFASKTLWLTFAGISVVTGLVAALVSAQEEIKTTDERLKELTSTMQTLDTNETTIETYYELSAAMENSELSAEELESTQAALNQTVTALKEAYPELLGELEAGTEAWELQTAAIYENIEAQKVAGILEMGDNAEALARRYQSAADRYAEAAEAQQTALEGMRSAETIDFDGTISEIQAMADALAGDIQAGTVTVDYEDGSAYMEKIKAIENAFQSISGEHIEIYSLADVSEQLQRYSEGADSALEVTNKFREDYVDATAAMAMHSETMAETSEWFKTMLEYGAVTAEEISSMGISFSDLGVTAGDVWQQIAEGERTFAEAAAVYGKDNLEDMIYSLDNMGQAGASAGESMGDSAEISHRKFLQLTKALDAVNEETMTAEGAAAAFQLELEELNTELENAEAYASNVEQAVAAADEGFLTAESAAQRFGVSLEAMEAYRSVQGLEDLEEQLKEIQDAYDNAYSSAYDSLMGQQNLIQSMPDAWAETETELNGVFTSTKILNENTAYIRDYNAALEKLKELNLPTDMLATYCDTSAEGIEQTLYWANQLTGMDDAEAAQVVNDLTTAWENNQTAISTASQNFADVQTNYAAILADIQADYEATESAVAESMASMAASMNQSGAAYSNGSATAQAYINAIWAKVSAAKAASNALVAAGTPSSYISGGTYYKANAAGGFTSGPELAGEDPRYPVEAVISFNPQYREENIGYLKTAAAMLGMSLPEGSVAAQESSVQYEYAGLTDYGAMAISAWRAMQAPSAQRQAPVYLGSTAFNGGAMSASISYAPTIQMSSGTSREEIIGMLRKYDEELADRIMEIKSDMERNERRTRYA